MSAINTLDRSADVLFLGILWGRKWVKYSFVHILDFNVAVKQGSTPGDEE